MTLNRVWCSTGCGTHMVFAVQLRSDGTVGQTLSPLSEANGQMSGNLELVVDDAGEPVLTVWENPRTGRQQTVAVYRILSLGERAGRTDLWVNHWSDCRRKHLVQRRVGTRR